MERGEGGVLHSHVLREQALARVGGEWGGGAERREGDRGSEATLVRPPAAHLLHCVLSARKRVRPRTNPRLSCPRGSNARASAAAAAVMMTDASALSAIVVDPQSSQSDRKVGSAEPRRRTELTTEDCRRKWSAKALHSASSQWPYHSRTIGPLSLWSVGLRALRPAQLRQRLRRLFPGAEAHAHVDLRQRIRVHFLQLQRPLLACAVQCSASASGSAPCTIRSALLAVLSVMRRLPSVAADFAAVTGASPAGEADAATRSDPITQ